MSRGQTPMRKKTIIQICKNTSHLSVPSFFLHSFKFAFNVSPRCWLKYCVLRDDVLRSHLLIFIFYYLRLVGWEWLLDYFFKNRYFWWKIRLSFTLYTLLTRLTWFKQQKANCPRYSSQCNVGLKTQTSSAFWYFISVLSETMENSPSVS